MHNGFLQIGEEKMSKSLGNMLNIKDALKNHSSDALRVFILSGQYRSPLSLSDEGMEGAEKGTERLARAVNREDSVAAGAGSFDAEPYRKQFMESMDDDFNTAQGLSILFDLARALNQAADSGINISEGRKLLKELAGDVMGLRLASSESKSGSVEAAPFIELLIKTRYNLRQAKQYQMADEIRIKLTELGIILEDTPKGTAWRSKR
jgi:cysteinyl-tRNA synthetase